MESAEEKEEADNNNYDGVTEDMLIPEIQIKQETDLKADNCTYNSYKDLKHMSEHYDDECTDNSYTEEHYDRFKFLCNPYINNADEPSCSKESDKTVLRERFLIEMLKSEKEKSSHFNVLTKDKYLELILQVEEAERAENKTPLQQRRLKRFAILNIGDEKKLISRTDGNIRYYLPAEQLFDVIDATHMAVDHGGRDKMLAETSLRYANVTREMIILYLSMCETCQQKKPKKKKNSVPKSILHSIMNSRCQIDLIDLQTQPDGKFKYVMVYQDYSTKFILLRALESNKPSEVSYHLNDIFLTIGAPCILQSDSGRDFVHNIIRELAKLWPELKIVHGKPRHSPGSVENVTRDIENMICSWLKDNKSTKWSKYLQQLQFKKNSSYHLGIKQSPYKAMFGIEPRAGLSTTSLPTDVINDIQDEEDFKKLIEEDFLKNKNGIGNNIDNECSTAENYETRVQKPRVAFDSSYLPVTENITNGIHLENDNSLYKTEQGILQRLIYRTEFDTSTQHFLHDFQAHQEMESPFNPTIGLGPVLVRCTCTKNCLTNRCQCKKRMLICNSKCHKRMLCDNK